MEWEPHSCASTPHSDGNMNVGAVVITEGLELLNNVCDYMCLGEYYVENYEMPNTTG